MPLNLWNSDLRSIPEPVQPREAHGDEIRWGEGRRWELFTSYSQQICPSCRSAGGYFSAPFRTRKFAAHPPHLFFHGASFWFDASVDFANPLGASPARFYQRSPAVATRKRTGISPAPARRSASQILRRSSRHRRRLSLRPRPLFPRPSARLAAARDRRAW